MNRSVKKSRKIKTEDTKEKTVTSTENETDDACSNFS